MGDVVQITGKRVFTLSEANSLIPLIYRITKKYEDRVEKLLSDQRFYMRTGAPKSVIDKVDLDVTRLLIEWGAKITKLGGVTLGSKVVSFDSGFGYWSWVYPDKEITHYYDYHEGVHNRRTMGVIYK